MPGISMNGSVWGVIFWMFGIITIVISLVLQFLSIDNGSSGQLAIASGLQQSLWPILTACSLMAIGYTLWLTYSTMSEQGKFTALFIFAFISFIISNFAMLFSLYQVQVTS